MIPSAPRAKTSFFSLPTTNENIANSTRTGVAYLGWANIPSPCLLRSFACNVTFDDFLTYGEFVELPFVLGYGANPITESGKKIDLYHGKLLSNIYTQGGALPQTYGASVVLPDVYVPETIWLDLYIFTEGTNFTYVGQSGMIQGITL